MTISGSNAKFDACDIWWSANGGSITSIAAFVILASNATSGNSVLVGWGKVSDSAVDITNTNRITLQWASTGIYTVS